MSRSNLRKHWENMGKFGSCPVRRTALLTTFNSLGFQLFWLFRFFAFLASSFGVL